MKQKFTTKHITRKKHYLSSYDFVEEREGHYYEDPQTGLLRFYDGDFTPEELPNLEEAGFIKGFRGEYFYLSNFFMTKFRWDGLFYSSSEAAYQSGKTLRKDLRMDFTELYPAQSKKKGQELALRDDWEDVKREIMYNIVSSKFRQNTVIRDKLISTGHKRLVEENDWGDFYWGRVEGVGYNYLGKTIMRIRRELQKERGL